eukprot:jgi/Galph1/3077/GphlegSOOS_G1707.1
MKLSFSWSVPFNSIYTQTRKRINSQKTQLAGKFLAKNLSKRPRKWSTLATDRAPNFPWSCLHQHPSSSRQQPVLATSQLQQTSYFRVTLGVLILYLMDRMFAFIQKKATILFPSSLSAMMFMFGILLLPRMLSSKEMSFSDHIVAWFDPSVKFLSSWLAVFFVPNLVLLPLFPVREASELMKLSFLIVFCLILTLLFAAYNAVLFARLENQLRGVKKEDNRPNDQSLNNTVPPKLSILLFYCFGTVISALWIYFHKSIQSVAFYIFSLSLTLLGFIIGSRFPKSVRIIMHPITFCTAFTITGISFLGKLLHVPLKTLLEIYLNRGQGITRGGAGSLLLTFLSPAVVSFAFQMYRRRRFLHQRILTLLMSCTLSSLFSLFGTAYVAKLLSVQPVVRVSLIPRSMTVPLAVAVSSILKGDIPLTSTAVAVTGIIGANVNKLLLSLCGIHEPVARGIATGASAHGLGTAAMVDEPEAFPFAAISMTLVATISTIFTSIPIIRRLLLLVAGLG